MKVAMSRNNRSHHLEVAMTKMSSRYTIMIHDKNEYVINRNYIKRTEIENRSKYLFIKIRKIEMVTNCENSESYSFRNCVEDYMAQRAGCRPFWFEEKGEYPLCNLNETYQYLQRLGLKVVRLVVRLK